MDKAVKFAFMVKAEYNKNICVSAIPMVSEIAGKNAKKMETGGVDMIVIYAECLVNPQKTDEFVKLAGQLVAESKKEQGNVSYELIHCREGRNIYAFLEKWQDQDILDMHLHSKHFTTIFPQIEKLLICPAKLNSYTVEA